MAQTTKQPTPKQLPSGTVKSRLTRARQALRADLLGLRP